MHHQHRPPYNSPCFSPINKRIYQLKVRIFVYYGDINKSEYTPQIKVPYCYYTHIRCVLSQETNNAHVLSDLVAYRSMSIEKNTSNLIV